MTCQNITHNFANRTTAMGQQKKEAVETKEGAAEGASLRRFEGGCWTWRMVSSTQIGNQVSRMVRSTQSGLGLEAFVLSQRDFRPRTIWWMLGIPANPPQAESIERRWNEQPRQCEMGFGSKNFWESNWSNLQQAEGRGGETTFAEELGGPPGTPAKTRGWRRPHEPSHPLQVPVLRWSRRLGQVCEFACFPAWGHYCSQRCSEVNCSATRCGQERRCFTCVSANAQLEASASRGPFNVHLHAVLQQC